MAPVPPNARELLTVLRSRQIDGRVAVSVRRLAEILGVTAHVVDRMIDDLVVDGSIHRTNETVRTGKPGRPAVVYGMGPKPDHVLPFLPVTADTDKVEV